MAKSSNTAVLLNLLWRTDHRVNQLFILFQPKIGIDNTINMKIELPVLSQCSNIPTCGTVM